MASLAGRVAGDKTGPASRAGFAAGHEAGIDHLAADSPQAAPDLLDRGHLGGREAVRSIRAATEQCLGVEFAAPRIVQHPILDSVQRVALFVHGVGQDVDLVRRNIAIAIHRQHRPEVAADVVMRPIVRRVAGDDAVEVGRIALGFDHRFVAALGASTEIGVGRLSIVKRVENQLVGLRQQVGGAVGEIDDAFVGA